MADVVGLVPTMGALHRGHASLIEQARRDCETVVVSIFVNPLQFGSGEDLSRYPRHLEADLEFAEQTGADIIFAPPEREIYPKPTTITIDAGRLGEVLCGQSRPGHFSGVATIVVKLLNIVSPAKAYFGEKDWQQLVVVKAVAQELSLDVKIVAVPTVREPDGLAISSRNEYLAPSERMAAAAIYAALSRARDLIVKGEANATKIKRAAEELIAAQPRLKLEYFSICRPDDLAEMESVSGEVLVAAAVFAGKTRLIDNLLVKP